ncbi:uncharacterized protein LOC115239433 [Formica exsecta]|uniref:uncharacterized protein LOC115239433 n=1 Tax=Formica exsecta TaxID=72781 RepID=UPI001141CD83|nr:uncharacterized protein LOC115239433 [Formica exsecta]
MMTIYSTNRQFLSNMLWRLFGFLILGVFIAICSCEPVNRKLLLKTSEIIECIDNGNNTCGTNETFKTSSSDRENETQISRDIRQKSLDDNNVAEVSARKKDKKGNRVLLYLFAAMKAALIYGLLHGVAALAGKAVVIAKIALAIAIAAILKKNDHESVSYEVVKHPHTSYVQTHSSSVDYDHRSDYGDDRSDYVYEYRKRRIP